MDKSLFEQLGFTQNETKVYLALSELGNVSVGVIQKKTGLVAPRVYDALQRLIDKGLVSSFVLNKKKHFKAAEPSKLQSFLKEKMDIASLIISQFPKFPKEKNPSVEVFIGKEGVKTLAEDELNAKKIFVLWGSPAYGEKFTYFRPGYHKRRIEKKVAMYSIFSKEHQKYGKEFAQLPYTSVRFLPYGLPLTIIVYLDRVVITCWAEDIIAIRIKNQEFADKAIEQFKYFWDSARE